MAIFRLSPKTTAKRKRQRPKELATTTTQPRPPASIATEARPKDHQTMTKMMERRRRKRRSFNRDSSSVNSVTSLETERAFSRLLEGSAASPVARGTALRRGTTRMAEIHRV